MKDWLTFILLLVIMGGLTLWQFDARADELRCFDVDGKRVCITVLETATPQEVVPQ